MDEVKWQWNFVSCNFGLKSNVNHTDDFRPNFTLLSSITISYWFLYGLCSEPEWPTIPQRFLETIMEEDHPDGSVGRGIALTLIEQLILGCYVLFYYALWLLNRSRAVSLCFDQPLWLLFELWFLRHSFQKSPRAVNASVKIGDWVDMLWNKFRSVVL